MLASLLVAFFRYPVQGLLILGGASLLAPVVLPLAAAIIRPLVKPLTNFYLDLAEDVTEAVHERQLLKEAHGETEKAVTGQNVNKKLAEAANVAVLLDTL